MLYVSYDTRRNFTGKFDGSLAKRDKASKPSIFSPSINSYYTVCHDMKYVLHMLLNFVKIL